MSRLALALAVALAATAGAPPPPAHAQPAPQPLDPAVAAQLGEANDAFRRQNYDRAIELLGPLVAKDAIGEPRAAQVALEQLGASYWFTAANDDARLTFATLLKSAPDYGLDPLYYPPELITFFEQEKERLRKLGFIGTEPVDGSGANRPRVRLVRTVTERRMPTFAYLMPFAVGQFANDEGAKGTALAILQTVGIATNVATWIAIETMKKGGTNQIPQSQQGQAELLQILWIVGTGLFAASYGYSVIDGFIFRPDATSESERLELIAPDAPAEEPAKDDEAGIHWRVGPAPAGLGLGVGASF